MKIPWGNSIPGISKSFFQDSSFQILGISKFPKIFPCGVNFAIFFRLCSYFLKKKSPSALFSQKNFAYGPIFPKKIRLRRSFPGAMKCFLNGSNFLNERHTLYAYGIPGINLPGGCQGILRACQEGQRTRLRGKHEHIGPLNRGSPRGKERAREKDEA